MSGSGRCTTQCGSQTKPEEPIAKIRSRATGRRVLEKWLSLAFGIPASVLLLVAAMYWASNRAVWRVEIRPPQSIASSLLEPVKEKDPNTWPPGGWGW